jgi:hypothetical protein
MSDSIEKSAAEKLPIPPSDQSIEFEFSLTGLNFRFKGPSHRAGQALHQGLQQSLTGLMNTPRIVMTEPDALQALPVTPYTPTPPSTNGHTATGAETNGSTATKKPRKAGGAPLKDLIRGLKTEGYFAEPRGIEAIQKKLKDKGHSVTASSLSSRLKELTQKSELHRQQSDDGFTYKDSPFNDAPRPAEPPGEAAK